jgi:hypothetical protein
MNKRKIHYLGLNEHHRISWVDPINKACKFWADAGLSIATIARWTHLTKGQVIYRLRKLGISVTGYRNGEGARAAKLHAQYEASLQKAWKAG